MKEDGDTKHAANGCNPVRCCFCGKRFEPWDDGFGEKNDDACDQCDSSYEEGQFNDRELGD